MIRILLAEDNAMNRELIRDMLESRGYEVVEAADGQEALDKMANHRPDLALVDVQMPVLDGYAVVRHMRQHPHLSTVRAVALTAYAMHGDREKALHAGFDAHFSKPVDFAALFAEIERLLC